ncbi:MAG TPA: GNAT family N-acetyltransferase [Gaiellaceae bacterium]|nr:GNAT family N-acetyltransferase [Gaiellaceae bacterium]
MTREARVGLEAFRALYPDAEEAGGAVVMRAPAGIDAPMLNRIVGLGVERPATEADVDAALACMGEESSCYVSVAADARPAGLARWLQARGLRAGWGWMGFHRPAGEMEPRPETALRLLEVSSPEEASAFGKVIAAGYELPAAATAWAATAPGRGWLCWLALDGDEPAAAAALFVLDGAGYLGFAATLPDHRRKGAQGALLAVRMERARALGCDLLVTETGERREGLPSNSYRNILRAGFEETGVTANWLRPGG